MGWIWLGLSVLAVVVTLGLGIASFRLRRRGLTITGALLRRMGFDPRSARILESEIKQNTDGAWVVCIRCGRGYERPRGRCPNCSAPPP